MEKNRIGIGTKVMWFRNHSMLPYAEHFVDTIVSESKTEFKTQQHKKRIKKDTLYIVGEPYTRVELYNEKKYREDYVIPRELFLKRKYIRENIYLFFKLCDKKDLDKLYVKIRNIVEKNKEAK